MLHTRVCDLLGIEHPIICAPMGFVTGPELAAAVSEAGGFGILQAGLRSPARLREALGRIRELTTKPFGVNFIQRFPHEEGVEVCLERGVTAVSFFWGDPGPFVERAHAAGVKVIDQVGSVEAARHDADAGVDLIIAQGVEAGGHLAGTISILALIPRVVDAVAPVPVAAAGGIADARGVAAVLALGAGAAVLGTRFLASHESTAHPEYKRQVVAADENQTIYTTVFGRDWPDAPHRVLRTPAALSEGPLDSLPPSAGISGGIDLMPLYAGQGVGLIQDIRPAGDIVRELAEGAERVVSMRSAGATS
jgi:nitronate monooxygenase